MSRTAHGVPSPDDRPLVRGPAAQLAFKEAASITDQFVGRIEMCSGDRLKGTNNLPVEGMLSGDMLSVQHHLI